MHLPFSLKKLHLEESNGLSKQALCDLKVTTRDLNHKDHTGSTDSVQCSLGSDHRNAVIVRQASHKIQGRQGTSSSTSCCIFTVCIWNAYFCCFYPCSYGGESKFCIWPGTWGLREGLQMQCGCWLICFLWCCSQHYLKNTLIMKSNHKILFQYF